MCRKDDDRLSSLPNDVLIIILSCLPTKSAISTSVLSWLWRDLWTQLTVLRFKTSDLSTNMFNRGFFVTFRQMSWQKINSLEIIVATSTSKSYIDNLFEDVLHVVPNVKELRVKIETGGDLIHVPRCILKKPTIESLEMDGVMITKLGHDHRLSILRKLIINVRNGDLFYLENVLKSCPSLKILRVWVDTTEKLTDPIEIKSRNLKWVCLNLGGTCEACSEGKKQVMIDAPKLEYLEVNSPVLLKFCFLKTPIGLSRAKLSMGGYESSMFPRVQVPKHILTILNPIFRVKTLSLCGNHILSALYRIGENKVEMFRKLTCVEIKLGCDLDYSSMSGARKFLKACPNLKKLVLSMRHGTLFRVKWLFSFMVENNSEFASLQTFKTRRLKLIGDFDRVEKDGKIMVEITTHVYDDDQLINYAKGFALPNQMWDCGDSTYVNSLLRSMELCLGRTNFFKGLSERTYTKLV